MSVEDPVSGAVLYTLSEAQEKWPLQLARFDWHVDLVFTLHPSDSLYIVSGRDGDAWCYPRGAQGWHQMPPYACPYRTRCRMMDLMQRLPHLAYCLLMPTTDKTGRYTVYTPEEAFQKWPTQMAKAPWMNSLCVFTDTHMDPQTLHLIYDMDDPVWTYQCEDTVEEEGNTDWDKCEDWMCSASTRMHILGLMQ